MEYFLARAMEIARLSLDQVDFLQLAETNRGLMPYEIQTRFGLNPAKEHHQIPPDDLNGQATHNQRLRAEFRRFNIYPEGGDLQVCDAGLIHAFDRHLLKLLQENKINLFYMGGRPVKKRLSEQVG